MDLQTCENISDFEKNTTCPIEETILDFWADAIVRGLHHYYTPVLIFLGAIGNLVSLYVLCTSKLCVQAASHYLAALTLSDTIFLIQLLPPWLGTLQITKIFYHPGFCQISVYLSYLTCCTSAWLVVAFTVERFVAVLYPLQRTIVCSVKRTRYIILGITFASAILNVPVLRFTVSAYGECTLDVQYLPHAARFNLVDTALAFTIPLTIIIILNTWIIVGVCQLDRIRRQLMRTGQSTVRQGLRPITIGCTHSQRKVTRMLLIVSSVFVILNMPAYAMRVVAYAYNLDMEKSSGRWKALQQLVLLLFYSNFGINFLLYSLSGQNFREALLLTFPCTRRYAPQPPTVRRTPAFRLAHYSSANSLAPESYSGDGSTIRMKTLHQNYKGVWKFNNDRQRAARQASRNNHSVQVSPIYQEDTPGLTPIDSSNV